MGNGVDIWGGNELGNEASTRMGDGAGNERGNRVFGRVTGSSSCLGHGGEWHLWGVPAAPQLWRTPAAGTCHRLRCSSCSSGLLPSRRIWPRARTSPSLRSHTAIQGTQLPPATSLSPSSSRWLPSARTPSCWMTSACPQMPSAARGQILQHLQGGSPGAYNLEYVTSTVTTKVARYLEQRDGGIPSDPHYIVPCSGTAAAVVDVVSLVVDEAAAQPTGVLVPVPGPPRRGAAVGLAGAVAVPYPLAEERGWAVATEALRRALRRARARCHPKVLCVVNPGDPTGHVLSRQNMEEIIRLAAEENLLLLADEVQQERAFLPGRPFLSFKRVLWEMGAPLASTVQLISFYSLSKGIGGGGYRAGFFELVNIDPSVLRCFYTWGLSVYPPILGQVMLQTAMDPPLPTEPSYPEFEEKLLEATGLVVAPGSEFGQEGGHPPCGAVAAAPGRGAGAGAAHPHPASNAAFLREFS
ncbi:alanine aminotransferase 1-like [Strix aluco]|uniref:alanine aminotransferase 1-like n=1 Tax=Strix aluco TaxID=111821 RepID=UPI003DA21E71